MARLGPKNEHARGWTANTFMPDHGIPNTLDAISENAMDEDLLQVEDAAQALLESTAENMTILTSNQNMEEDEVGHNENDSEGSDEEEEDDQNHIEEDDEEEDDGESSQDQGTSEDSEEDTEGHAEESGDSSERINVSKRSRTGVASKKRRSSLSTSPSNSSKVVSATPTKKITKKSKKSVKSKGSKGALNGGSRASEEAKLEAAKPIVSRFLELENTKLNDKLMAVFMINGMIPFIIESITRLDPEVAKELEKELETELCEDPNQESKFMIHDKQCRRKRDYSDISLMKKSYIAMNFFLRGDVYCEFILSNLHQTIVKELFKVFRPESNGNFYHFQKLFEIILKKFRAQTMATLFTESSSEKGNIKTPLVFDVLPYLDQNPVALCLSRVLFPTYTYGIAEKIQDYYKILQEGHFMEMLLAMVTLRDEPSQNMADFVVSLLDEVTRAKDAKIIFTCLADDPIWAQRLVQGVKSTSPVQRHGCIEIIYSILVRSIQVPYQDAFANSMYISERSHEKVESHMEKIATEFGKHLSPYIPDLCHAFIGSKSNGGQVTLPGYTIPKSFTVARLWLLDSIYHCLNDVDHNPALLKLIPEEFWSILVDSFIQFRFNNAFHVHFYKLFRVVLYSEQAEVYDRFIVKPNIIGRLIEHYLTFSVPTGSKGYIILILNCIRLSSDLEKKNNDEKSIDPEGREGKISLTFWENLIQSTPEWNDFQPTLREATLEQTRDTSCQMDPNLRFQFAPLQSKHPHEAPLTKRHTGIPGVSARGIDGIDLGSKYGNSLGFGVPMKYDREADEQANPVVQTHQLQIQKALASLKPVDWRLIPPQRVVNAMLGLNSDNNKGNSVTGIKQGLASGSAGVTLPSNADSKESTSNDSTSTTTTKAKKKKKNKKKNQSSNVNTESSPDKDAAESESTNSSTADQSEMSDLCEDESDGTKDTESVESSEDDSDSKSGADETEEERLARKREKKREKKRKNKMNKKNKVNQQLDNSQ